MKKYSVKVKITIWLLLLMAVLSLLLLLFMLSVSNRVVRQAAVTQLSETVRDKVAKVYMSQGKLHIDPAFGFHENGVSILIYSKNQALLAGQLPVAFSAPEAFENGEIRVVTAEHGEYLLLDLWRPSNWEEGIWIRGILEAPGNRQTTEYLLILSGVTLPSFVLLAALGGYLILRRAFRPLDRINATAASINEVGDLSRRIGLQPGKDEFSRLAANFDALFERLETSFETVKQFTADASHELRTPVSIIKGACEYGMKFDETPEERGETLRMIHRQSVRMSELIAQLLSMTRLDQGTEAIAFRPLELGSFVGELCEEREYERERLTVALDKDAWVKGDPVLLSRLTSNLIDNAFKYGKEKGHVWVYVQRRETEVLLQVKDNGIGIPKEEQEKIWKRFYQVDASRSDEDAGTGLGLAMVRQIARLHGGYMTLESIPDTGSEFTLHLPLAESKEV
ncbi:MAG: HAMP domain-containing histidine kinase [Lachnospiraceae bacterium]|nr:HAMP domain-containing histidine kinase [Lachnospiraceae bacterium]